MTVLKDVNELIFFFFQRACGTVMVSEVINLLTDEAHLHCFHDGVAAGLFGRLESVHRLEGAERDGGSDRRRIVPLVLVEVVMRVWLMGAERRAHGRNAAQHEPALIPQVILSHFERQAEHRGLEAVLAGERFVLA